MSEDATIHAVPPPVSFDIGRPVPRAQELFRPCRGGAPQSAADDGAVLGESLRHALMASGSLSTAPCGRRVELQ